MDSIIRISPSMRFRIKVFLILFSISGLHSSCKTCECPAYSFNPYPAGAIKSADEGENKGAIIEYNGENKKAQHKKAISTPQLPSC